jgi:hypothetical protein
VVKNILLSFMEIFSFLVSGKLYLNFLRDLQTSFLIRHRKSRLLVSYGCCCDQTYLSRLSGTVSDFLQALWLCQRFLLIWRQKQFQFPKHCILYWMLYFIRNVHGVHLEIRDRQQYELKEQFTTRPLIRSAYCVLTYRPCCQTRPLGCAW